MNWLAGISGLVLSLIVASEAFEVMLLPRRVRRSLRFVRLFFRYTWKGWSSLAKSLGEGSRRENLLSLYGPLSMMFLLSFWAVGLIVGFGLLQWAVRIHSPSHLLSVLEAVYFSGSSFFTVGFGDVLPKTPLAKGLAVFEAGTGLAFIAVTIGYLPVLYQLFSRREAQVIQLDARAGSPPTAVELLCRHSEHEALDELQSLLRDWEQWCAVLIESHLSYPMLSYYRSQHDNQSWLAAIAAILDCCALLLTGFTGVHTFAARMTFAMARLAIVELCRVFQLRTGVTPMERLPTESFEELCAKLLDAGLAFSDEETAEERLSALRATYEPFLFALSEQLVLTLPPWLPSDDDMDNWQRSSRGKSAKKLIDSVPAEPR